MRLPLRLSGVRVSPGGFPTASARRRRRRPSCRRRTAQLSLEGGDVPLPEAPLAPLLDRGKNALAGQLVHRIRTAVEDLRDLFAVEQAIFRIDHGGASRDTVLVAGASPSVKKRRISERSPGLDCRHRPPSRAATGSRAPGAPCPASARGAG